MSVARRQDLVTPEHPALSVVRQCALLAISRSGFYYEAVGDSEANLALMRLIDQQFLETPFYGSRQMMRHLQRMGHIAALCVREVVAYIGSEPLGARIAESGSIRTGVQRSDSGATVAAGEFGDRLGVA